jgi:hypothetical protein
MRAWFVRLSLSVFSLLSEAEQPKTIQVSVKDAQGVSGWRADVTRS